MDNDDDANNKGDGGYDNDNNTDDNSTGKNVFVIKKNSWFLVILTPEYRFMDISNF